MNERSAGEGTLRRQRSKTTALFLPSTDSQPGHSRKVQRWRQVGLVSFWNIDSLATGKMFILCHNYYVQSLPPPPPEKSVLQQQYALSGPEWLGQTAWYRSVFRNEVFGTMSITNNPHSHTLVWQEFFPLGGERAGNFRGDLQYLRLGTLAHVLVLLDQSQYLDSPAMTTIRHFSATDDRIKQLRHIGLPEAASDFVPFFSYLIGSLRFAAEVGFDLQREIVRSRYARVLAIGTIRLSRVHPHELRKIS